MSLNMIINAINCLFVGMHIVDICLQMVGFVYCCCLCQCVDLIVVKGEAFYI